MIQLANVDSAFSEKSKIYDSYGTTNSIVKVSRKIVRETIIANLPVNGKILEIN